MIDDLPIFGICGWSGSGKTTLIESILPVLRSRGLRVAIVKHDVHGIDVDRQGKDSDRFFRAGADVFLRGRGEEFSRCRPSGATDVVPGLMRVCRGYDLVLVEGYKQAPIPKVWLLSSDRGSTPDDPQIIDTLPFGPNRPESVMEILDAWLPRQWLRTPVNGCVLVDGHAGGSDRRPRLDPGERKGVIGGIVDRLSGVVETIVLAGEREEVASSAGHLWLPDAPDAKGPMAGMLSAMRWGPNATWIIVASNLPDATVDAFTWLLSTRAPGVWATLPRLKGSPGVEPLLAHYDFRSCALLETLAARRYFSPAAIASMANIISPAPPDATTPAWGKGSSPGN